MTMINKTYLDKLQIDEIFDFYDMPRIFTSKAPAGQTYLVINIAEDDESATWLYVAISNGRLTDAKYGRYDIRYLCENAEDGVVNIVKVFVDNRDCEIRQLESRDIDSNLLPQTGEYLLEDEDEDEFLSKDTLKFSIDISTDMSHLMTSDDDWKKITLNELSDGAEDTLSKAA